MKSIHTIILLLLTLPSLAQNISGSVVNSNNEPLPYVSVTLTDTKLTTKTDENGIFQFQNVKPGTYTVIVNASGYSAIKQNIQLDNEDVMLSLRLEYSTHLLEEVTVDNTFKTARDKASGYASKLPISDIENPQIINLVSNTIIQEQAVFDNTTALKNAAGVTKGWASTNGYYTSRGFNTRSYMRNGITASATADIDFANLESLQVIKGPSGSLFGSSLVSFGGVINRITKKPFSSFYLNASYLGGSHDLNRFTFDVNSPISKDHNLFFRLNASKHYSGSFQDSGFINTTFIAPAFFYKIDETLSISLDAEIYSREQTSQTQIAPIGPKQNTTGADRPSLLPIQYKKSYSNNTITLKGPTAALYAQIEKKISSNWISQTNIVRTTSENSGNYITFNLLKGDSLLVRNISHYPSGQNTATQIQQNFNGDFKIGRLRNRLLIGFDYYQTTSTSSSNALNGRGRPSYDTLNLKRPGLNYTWLSPELIESRLQAFTPDYRKSDAATYALYVSDVVNLTDRLTVLLGARLDRIINKGTTNIATDVTTGMFNQTAISPKIGMVYELIKNRISVFGNYMNGFQNVAPVTQPDGTLSVFKPQYANQFEIGLKTDLVRDLLTASICYYDINVSNTLRPDVDAPTFTVQEGTQYSKGFELDLYSRPLKGILINAGFGYNDSKITSGSWAVDGLRTANSGPEQTLNLYASYKIQTTKIQGLGIGFGANYTGENLIINNSTAGQFYLDSYTILNSALFYEQQRYRLAINMDNLSNKEYYTGGFGSFTPGMLRRIMASISLKF